MRYTLSILALIISNCTFAQQPEWKLSHPTPQSPPLSISDVAPLDSLTAFIAGDFKRLGYTTDGGKSWHYSVVNAPNKDSAVVFSTLHFFDKKYGWAASGKSGIARTTDGGISWQWNNSLQVTTPFLFWNDMAFTDSLNGYAVGSWLMTSVNEYRGIIARTTDGGISWNGWAPDSVAALTSCAFLNKNTGFAVGNNEWILRTSDGGVSWQRMTPTRYNDPSRVSILPSGRIVVIVGRRLRFSDDSGITWQTDSVSTLRPMLIFADSLHGISAGGFIGDTKGGRYFTTEDGGSTWVPDYFAPGVESISASLVQASVAAKDGSLWMTDNRGMILRSLDAGKSWKNLAGYSVPFLEITFNTARSGWTRGSTNANLLLHTADGGQTWAPHFPLDTAKRMSAGPYFLNELTGWYIAGTSAGVKTLEKTIDGGQTWQTLPSPPPSSAIYLFPASEMELFVKSSGSPPQWYYSTDGGMIWKNQEFLTQIDAAKITVQRQTGLGVVGGNHGDVGMTTDGGRTWDYAPSAPSEQKSLLSPAIINSNTWWIGGKKGWLVSTTDGGTTWRDRTMPNIPSHVSILNIAFSDAKNGALTVAGSQGEYYAYMTTDGGDTWFIPSTAPLGQPTGYANGLCLAPDGTFWVSGDNGMILSWKPDITNVEEEILSSGIIISPNPSIESFQILCPEAKSVTVRNVFGEIMNHVEIATGGQAVISTVDLPSGVYFVEALTISGKRMVEKIVVSK